MDDLRAGAKQAMAGNPPPGFTVGGDDFFVADWDSMTPEAQQRFLDASWRMYSRGEKVDGTKPTQVVDGSIGQVRTWQTLMREGDGPDVPYGSDTHPLNIKAVIQRQDEMDAKLDLILEHLTGPPAR
jgi:hypothetical protein